MSSNGHEFKRRGIMGLIGLVDREGWLAILAAMVLGILLGMIWSPLLWVGLFSAIVIFFASRGASRITSETGYVSPVDGIAISMDEAVPPLELKLGTEPMQRLRIASSPVSSNPIWTVADATFGSQIIEEGDPQKFYAGSAEGAGLKRAFLGFETKSGKSLGLIVTTGALGPRLDIDARIGRELTLGDQIGKRRLGGWCDVYLPLGTDWVIRPGQTLIGGETMLSLEKQTRRVSADVAEETTDLEDVIRHAEVMAETEEVAETDNDPEAAAARQFERLKRETEKPSDDT